MFNAAEGNATFYGLPTAGTVQRWVEEAPEDFHFCFKFPKTISHERRLIDAAAETNEFLTRVAPLEERLGTFFLQLHQSFGPEDLSTLESFLKSLPGDFQYAVEVRHPDFFEEGAPEQALHELLVSRGVERVNFDTRGLFGTTATGDMVSSAQRKKPRVPIRFVALGKRPFVRFVGDPNLERDYAWLSEWSGHFARWLKEGREPYFFAHHVDDLYAPEVARLFQQIMHERCPQVAAPTPWPAELEASSRGHQLDLL